MKITKSEQIEQDSITPEIASFEFVKAVLRMMVALWFVVIIVGTLLYHAGFWGFISGGGLAIIIYLVVMQAGRIFISSQSYAKTMAWLILAHFVLWIVMAVLLAAIKVNPLGFILGASILLGAIILTLVWFTVRKRRLPS